MSDELPDVLGMEKAKEAWLKSNTGEIEAMLAFFERLLRLQTSPEWLEFEKTLRLRMDGIVRRMTGSRTNPNVMLRCAGAVAELRAILSGGALARERVNELKAHLKELKGQEALRVAGSHPEV